MQFRGRGSTERGLSLTSTLLMSSEILGSFTLFGVCKPEEEAVVDPLNEMRARLDAEELPESISSLSLLAAHERFCMVLFQWFLMALSVRPGRCFAISAQRFPYFLCNARIFSSSSCVNAHFLIFGSRWLCHLKINNLLYLSRHCFPRRPPN